jgi:hypothetical protein
VSDELRTILRLVAEGHLSPEEAAPIIEALSGDPDIPRPMHPTSPPAGSPAPGFRAGTPGPEGQGVGAGGSRVARQLRIRVTERGRQVVNLNIPLGFADRALRMVPGIGDEQSDRIRAAIASGAIGPIVDVEDADGSGVRISID